MFDCCSKTYSRVDASLGLTRAFALVGLLRHVDDSVPRDLTYIYLQNTDQCGFGSAINDRLTSWYDSIYVGNNQAVEECNRITRGTVDPTTCEIPSGLERMAKEYFARCYWDQVKYLLNFVYDPKNTNHTEMFVEHERMYPTYVRTALDALNLPYHTDLKMARSRINGLYSAIMPTGGNVGEGIAPWNDKHFPGDYNVLTISQIRKIASLRNLAGQCLVEYATTETIPDVLNREVFCNLLDILLVLCGSSSRGFTETRQFKQVYEYSKMASTMELGGCRSKFPRSVGITKQHYIYNSKVDAAVETLSHLSPHAALCLGKDCRCLDEINHTTRYYKLTPYGEAGGWNRVLREFLRKLNPRPMIETRLYVEKELAVERQKLHELIRNQGCDKNTNYCEPAGEWCDTPVPCCCG